MENQGNQNFIHNGQEFDFVDLIAVLWRRKAVVIAVSVLVVVIGLVLFIPKNKSSISTLVMIGEITKQVDGNEVLERIMSLNESKQILEYVYLPEAIDSIAQGDDLLYEILSKNITVNGGDSESVNGGDSESSSGGLVLISSSVTDKYTENVTGVLNNATTKLLELQNKTYENHQARIQNRIENKKLSIQILTDPRRIKSEKLDLKNDRFSNEAKLEKNVDKELLKQEELKHQRIVNAAEKNLNAAIRSLTRENAALKGHEDLIPVLEERLKTLDEELANVEKTRASLYDLLGGEDSSSTLLTEALLAIDNRDNRYRNQIYSLNQQLSIVMPQARTGIETRLESLTEQIELAEQNVAIAKQNLAVFRVQKVYNTKELENTSDTIETKFDSFDASHEAGVLRLKADIATLELSLALSTPSKVVASPTLTSSSKTSLKVIGIGALFVGGMLGCFVAFFIELLSQARIRAAETV